MKPHWTQPSHPDALEVISQPGSFLSYSQATRSFPPGTVLARLTAPILTLSDRAYSSVQVGSSANIELNCDFLYINHSCEPNLEFRVSGSDNFVQDSKVQKATKEEHPIVIEIVAANNAQGNNKQAGIKVGDELTFFYPSTEWDMDQPFECQCKTASCKGLIRGAKYLTPEEMKGYFINQHIWELKRLQMEERDDDTTGSGSGSTPVTIITSSSSSSD